MKVPKDLRWEPTGRTLGEGGQGTVCEVIDRTAAAAGKYALKALKTGNPHQAYERFAREIEAIASLQHTSIIKIVDHSKPGDAFHFYVMELAEGAKPLMKVMSSSDNRYYGDPTEAVALFERLALVIECCEQKQIVHRDLSPANVLILPDGSIKVIDFGLCHVIDAETITLTDEGVGTPSYMAPECEPGAQGGVSSASDLYSAGKIVWSAITGKRAFARESPAFGTHSMHALFPERPGTWHLHHLFAKTIRRRRQDRVKDAPEALALARQVKVLLSRGYPPFEVFASGTCPLCGFGRLKGFEQSYMVFGNPDPPGIESVQCTYCGFCFAINANRVREEGSQRERLE